LPFGMALTPQDAARIVAAIRQAGVPLNPIADLVGA